MDILSQLASYSDTGLLILRVVLGAIFIFHGAPKLKSAQAIAKGMGMPAPAVMLLGLTEVVAGVAVILGIYTQIGAALLAAVMIGAIYFKVVKWNVPFYGKNTTGWEFDLILLAGALCLTLSDGGAFGLM